MKEYIERDKFYDIESLLMTDIVKENPVANDILEQVLFDIKEVPAADVKEVVHAKWINAYPYLEPNPMFMYGICSNCGTESSCKSNYCHDCGAKMDLELELTEYEKKCLFCKHNYKTLEDIPRCNCMCESHSDFELIENIKEKFHKENKNE